MVVVRGRREGGKESYNLTGIKVQSGMLKMFPEMGSGDGHTSV